MPTTQHHVHRAGLAAPDSAASAHPHGLAPLGASAAAPCGLSPAPNDEGPTGTNGQAFREQGKADSLYFDANRVGEQDKCFATARAKLALAGWVIHIVDGGGGTVAYWVSRWGQSRTLPDRHALDQFTKQVTGGKQ